MMRRIAQALAILLLVALGLGLALFFTEDGEEDENPSLTMGTSASITGALLFVAEDQKFFEKEGVDAEIKVYPSAAAGLDDMLAGGLDIAGAAETPIMHRAFTRKDFRVFATVCCTTNDPKIIAWQDKVGDDPANLAGKRVGSTHLGQSAHFFLHIFLLKHGVSADSVLLEPDKPSEVIRRLAAGEFDAAALFEPYAAQAAEALGARAVVFAEPGLYSKTFNLVALASFLDEWQEAVRRLLRALQRAERFAMDHPEQVEAVLKERTGADRELVRNYLAWSSLDLGLSNALIITLRDEAQWAIENNFASASQPPAFRELVDARALAAVKPESVTLTP